MRNLVAILALAGLTAVATAQNTVTKSKAVVRPAEQAVAADRADSTGLYNAALLELGATAKGSGAFFNKDWPPDNTLETGLWNGGTIFDKSGTLKGGRVDIRLLIPVDIKAIEVVGLDYHGTRQPKAIEIFVEGKLVRHADLEDAPGQVQRIALEARGTERRDPGCRRVSLPAAAGGRNAVGLRRLVAVAGADDDQCGAEDEAAGAV